MKLEDMNDKLMMQEIFLSLKALSLSTERIAKALEASQTHEELEVCDCHDCLTARVKRFEAKHPPETDSENDPPERCVCDTPTYPNLSRCAECGGFLPDVPKWSKYIYCDEHGKQEHIDGRCPFCDGGDN